MKTKNIDQIGGLTFKEYFSIDKLISPEVDSIIVLANLRRIFFMSICIASIQIFNFIDTRPKVYFNMRPFILSVFFVFVFFMSLSYLCIKNVITNVPFRKTLFISFWFFVVIGLLPFNILDIISIEQPFNLISIGLLLCLIPILSGKISMFVLLFYASVNIIIAFIFKASPFYISVIFPFCIIGFLISYLMKNPYFAMVIRTSKELSIDYLTQVYKISAWFTEVKKKTENCKKFNSSCAFFAIEIDCYNDYEQKLGDYACNGILQSVASALKLVFFKDADIICRGDKGKFYVCSICTESEVFSFANNIKTKIAELRIKNCDTTKSGFLTVSVGIAHDKPINDEDAQALLKVADDELVEAKNNGTNRISFKHQRV